MALVDKGFVKLVFSTNCEDQKEEFQTLTTNCIKHLTELSKEWTANFTFEDAIDVGTNNEFWQIDCKVTISGQPPLRDHFSSISHLLITEMKKFVKKNETDLLKIRTAVQVQDRSFFSMPKITGANIQVKTQEVFFGNLIKYDSFLTHYIVEDDPKNDWYGTPQMIRKYYGQEDDGTDDKTTIFTDFEHDRREMRINFPVIWKERQPQPDGKRVKVIKTEIVAKLRIDYKNIRRVFCDYDAESESFKMYLHVKGPPLVSIVKFSRRNKENKVIQQENLQSIQGDRFIHWIKEEKGKSGFEEDIRAVVESPYIFMKFPKESNKQCLNIFGRLLAANQIPIEIRQIDFYFPGKFRFKHLVSPLEDTRLKSIFRHAVDGEIRDDFEVIYMLQALLSRGAHVKDQFLVEQDQRTKFVKRLENLYDGEETDMEEDENRIFTLKCLENLLNACDENKDMQPLHEMFDKAISKTKKAMEIAELNSTEKAGYVRLQKVTITPTRKIFEAPELIMGNRVLRSKPKEFPVYKFLRVSFCDDDGSRIHAHMSSKLIDNFIMKPLVDGLVVAGRTFNYFGSSNSQMREQGCYFLMATDEEINEFRGILGRFETKSVPKLMARLGQCFTQSLVSDKVLQRERYSYGVEYLNEIDEQNPYIYSDGVGAMSKYFAREIAEFLNLGDYVPSCIQSRFRGFKGIHALNPNIDRLKEWSKRRRLNDANCLEQWIEQWKLDNPDCLEDPEEQHKIDELEKKFFGRTHSIDLLFRESQRKFKAPDNNQHYEIVKLSGPSVVALNRPLINILDQISAKQGYECHKRVTNRIFQLLDIQLQNLAHSLTNEREAHQRLEEFPGLIQFNALEALNLTEEPFFRLLLHISAKCTLTKLKTKLQVAIPENLGRTMFGVIDESGLLNYGQIYVRYTVNVQQKRPSPSAARKTLTGPVLVTRNPMIVGGDVRMLEAVDIPALRHLCDVIVFPRCGPRPHTDEMGGGDLDGDEYSVVWDPELCLNHSEPAFDYTAEKPDPIEVDEEKLRKQMAEFFVDYIKLDSVGTLATAFLVNSDIYGIESPVCDSVAKKHTEAVDFVKSGKPPKPLARGIPEINMPSEKPPRNPDFKADYHKPLYLSPRLNGRIFRRIKTIDDTLEVSFDDQLNSAPKIDENFYIDGYEQEMEVARENFKSYKAAVENLLQRFGINSEVEIFSSSYSTIRKRVNEEKEDNFSFFNTQHLIEKEIESIFSSHRRRLFEQHGKSFDDQVEWPYKTSSENQSEARVILRSVSRDPSKELQRLAVAYYRVAYGQDDQRFLSFAWLGADILSRVRQNCIVQKRQENPNTNLMANFYSFDPLSNHISDHIENYINTNINDFEDFRNRLFRNRQRNDTVFLLRAYCERHDGLVELLYFSYKWAIKNDLLINEPERTPEQLMKMEQEKRRPSYTRLTICLTFLQFGLDAFDGAQTNIKPFLEETEIQQIHKNRELPIIDPSLRDEVDLFGQHGGLGKKFLQFVEYLSSLSFTRLKRHTFRKFKNYSIFAQQQHIELNRAAERTYYQLCFNDNFNILPHTNVDVPIEEKSLSRPDIDGESFIFELPTKASHLAYNDECLEMIKKETKVDDLSIRVMPNKDETSTTTKCIAIVSGSFESVNKLRRFLAPTGFINCGLDEKTLAAVLSSQVENRLCAFFSRDKENDNF